MKVRLLIFLLLPAIAACATATPPPQPPAVAWVFSCDEGPPMAVRFRDERAILDLGERRLELPQVVAASGAKYSDGENLFWNKGRGAILQVGKGPRRQCRGVPAADPWQEAALLGASLRAIGQEPGWELAIIPGRQLRLDLDYGSRRIASPVPPPQQLNGGTLYSVDSAEGALIIRILPRACRDAMSGEPSPLTVEIDGEGRLLRGCGRPLP